MHEIPRGARRLFPHPEDVDPRKHLPYVIGRLLEEGDSADLRALTAAVPEDDLADWLRRRGGRRLSSRSRAFWSLVLDVPETDMPRPDLAEALWPL